MQNEKAQGLKDGLVKLIEALATDTDEARQSTLFTSYLRAVGMFHNYSWHNCALIWSQRPDASRVAGFQTWKKLGRYVVAGSKGIAIFAPMTFKDKSPAQDGTEQESMRVWFRVVYVFDVSQTRGEALAELPTECTGEGGRESYRTIASLRCRKGYCRRDSRNRGKRQRLCQRQG
jgi:hypothetical protein